VILNVLSFLPKDHVPRNQKATTLFYHCEIKTLELNLSHLNASTRVITRTHNRINHNELFQVD